LRWSCFTADPVEPRLSDFDEDAAATETAQVRTSIATTTKAVSGTGDQRRRTRAARS
jgi:hypothetical protein